MTLLNNERQGDLEELYRDMMESHTSGLQTALPAIIDSFSGNTVSCTAAIMGVVRLQDGTAKSVALPQFVDVPVVWPGGGGFTLTFPIAKGDECVVVFSSRCIDSWWSKGGVQSPLHSRMHSLSDGFALVGVRSKLRALTNVNASNVQLRNDAGTAFLEFTPAGALNITAPGGIHLNGQFNSTGDVIAGTVSLKTHVHSGVTSGGGTSGMPVP